MSDDREGGVHGHRDVQLAHRDLGRRGIRGVADAWRASADRVVGQSQQLTQVDAGGLGIAAALERASAIARPRASASAAFGSARPKLTLTWPAPPC